MLNVVVSCYLLFKEWLLSYSKFKLTHSRLNSKKIQLPGFFTSLQCSFHPQIFCLSIISFQNLKKNLVIVNEAFERVIWLGNSIHCSDAYRFHWIISTLRVLRALLLLNNNEKTARAFSLIRTVKRFKSCWNNTFFFQFFFAWKILLL